MGRTAVARLLFSSLLLLSSALSCPALSYSVVSCLTIDDTTRYDSDTIRYDTTRHGVVSMCHHVMSCPVPSRTPSSIRSDSIRYGHVGTKPLRHVTPRHVTTRAMSPSCRVAMSMSGRSAWHGSACHRCI